MARLIHLYKDPGAQVHWNNYYRSLNRRELNARKSVGANSEAANPLGCLTEMFNDYEGSQPQNLMVEYINGPNNCPIKKFPFKPSSDEWAELACHTHDIEPTNLSRKNIIRDESWIKALWNDVRKWLHAVFVMCNHSGQHDPDFGEWCSPNEMQRWVRASLYKTNGSNTIVRFQTAMIYSIAVLEERDFDKLVEKCLRGWVLIAP